MEKAKKGNNIYGQACCYTQYGDTKTAFCLLDKAVKERNVWLTFMVKTDWMLDPLRDNPHFHEILRTMHLE